jgi:hypothetical protein
MFKAQSHYHFFVVGVGEFQYLLLQKGRAYSGLRNKLRVKWLGKVFVKMLLAGVSSVNSKSVIRRFSSLAVGASQ